MNFPLVERSGPLSNRLLNMSKGGLVANYSSSKERNLVKMMVLQVYFLESQSVWLESEQICAGFDIPLTVPVNAGSGREEPARFKPAKLWLQFHVRLGPADRG